MKAWLMVNAFLQREKFDEIHQWLCEAGRCKKVDISVRTNEELLSMCDDGGLTLLPELKKIDFVLFWDKDILLARTLEQLGVKVFNSSHAIQVCDDKALTHFYLAKEKVPMPKTIFAPMTYANIGYTSVSFVNTVIEQLGLPMVIKESFGSFGQQVYLAKTKEEVFSLVKSLEGKSFFFQKYIAASGGRDIRLQVVGNQVVAAMERKAKQGDFRANISNGGSMKEYKPTEKEAQLAVYCCNILGVDFAGVDLLWGENGEPMVCEVNSNAHFKNIFDCTGVNTADYILSYILEQLKGLKEHG